MLNTKNNTLKETSISTSKLLFIVCCLVYASAYVARSNYSVVVNTMKELEVVGSHVAGLVSLCYFATYAMGQIVNGMLADKKSPFAMVVVGLSIITVAELLMFLFPSPSWLLIVFWGLNGFGQSMLWSPIFYIINNALNKEFRFKAVTLVALTTPIGKISGYFLSGLSLDISGGKWQSVFVMASVLIILMLSLWVSTHIALRNKIVFDTHEENADDGKPKTKGNFTKYILSSGIIFLFPAMIVHGLFLNGSVEWVPSMMQNIYGISESLSSYLMMLIPAFGVTGVFFANMIYKRFFKKNEGYCLMLFMLLSLVLVGILYLIYKFFGNSIVTCVAFVTVFALLYTVQLSYNHTSVSLVPMHFALYGCASTASGLLNAINYGGSAISTYALNFLTEDPTKTDLLFIIWASTLTLSAICLFVFGKHWKKFSQKTNIL